MATLPRIRFSVAKPLGGLSVAQENVPEAATQTFKQGAVVQLVAGYMQECGADPTLILGIASGPGQSGATAGAKNQSVYLAHPLNLFMGNIDDGSGTGVTAATDRGKMYGIAKHSSTGKWYVDNTDTTNKRVVIWDFWDGAQDGIAAAIGDTLGYVFFQFDPTYFQGSKTS
jgi:hypothetical protein